jgi:hypothetical protein
VVKDFLLLFMTIDLLGVLRGVEIDGNIEGHKVFRQGWLLEDNNSMSYILVYYNLFHSVLSYLSFYMPRG